MTMETAISQIESLNSSVCACRTLIVSVSICEDCMTVRLNMHAWPSDDRPGARTPHRPLTRK